MAIPLAIASICFFAIFTFCCFIDPRRKKFGTDIPADLEVRTNTRNQEVTAFYKSIQDLPAADLRQRIIDSIEELGVHSPVRAAELSTAYFADPDQVANGTMHFIIIAEIRKLCQAAITNNGNVEDAGVVLTE